MGFWNRLFGREKKAEITSSLDLFKAIYGGRETRSGATVSWSSALDVTAVLACCRVIAEGVAQVPWRVYRDIGDDKQPARDHPLYPLLFRQPNKWQTSFEFRETILFHTILTGNAFVFEGRVGTNRELRELIPIEPGWVTVERDEKTARIRYKVRSPAGEAQEFPQEAIWHVKGPSWNSWLGLDITRLAREAIGLAMATESKQSEFTGKSNNTTGMLAVKEDLSPEKFQFLSKWLDLHAPGGERAGRDLVMDGSATYSRFGMTGVDAQMLETRKHQVEDIARAFRVMPIMIGQADKAATYASAEQMFIAHVVHTLSPWYERLQQSADVNLLTEDEWRRDGYSVRFDPNALMRGAAKDQAEYYAKALGAGGGPAWMTQNEIRRLSDMPPLEGGDELYPPAAMMAAPEPEGGAKPPADDEEGKAVKAAVANYLNTPNGTRGDDAGLASTLVDWLKNDR